MRVKPVASLDCVAHEYGHGIEHLNPGLGYTTIEKALKEGLSDIWGAVLEYNIAPAKVHWKIAEEIMDNGKDCLRNIAYPKASTAHTKMADTYNGQYYDGTYYQKSGVFSHWFYLLSDGGSGTNDLSNDYLVYGIGINCATEIIFEAEIDHFDGVDSYSEARTAAIDAAEELFGESSLEVMQVQNAWYAVGVGSQPSQISLSGHDLVCFNPSKTFTLNDRPSGTSVNWTKSDNLTYVDGQTTDNYIVKAHPYGYGAGWVQANITAGNCDAVPIRYDIDWVGTPYIDPLTIQFTCAEGEGYFCTNALGNEYSFSYTGPYNYFDVKLTNLSETQTLWQDQIEGTWGTVEYYPAEGTYKFMVRGNNGCGTASNWSKTTVDYVDCEWWGFLNIVPNPATDEIKLELKTDDLGIFSEGDTWEAEIFSQQMLIMHKSTQLKDKTYTINVSSWNEGIYYVRAKVNDKIVSGKFIISR